eukprot:jgi/Galph1/3383/GphlegSOOS_G2032.1
MVVNNFVATCCAETTGSLCTDVVDIRRSEDALFLACGSYQHLAESGRIGSLTIYRLNEQRFFPMKECTNLPGILDCRWLDFSKVLCACSDGQIRLFDIKNQSGSCTFPICADSLVLGLDINPDGKSMICSDSLGQTAVIDLVQGSRLFLNKSHEAECWCVAFENSNVYWSGGDDGILVCWDIRCGSSPFPQVELDTKSLHTIRSSHHGVGITSILPCCSNHLLLSGGYDDCLVGHDIRMPKTFFFQYNMGGGVWKVKQHEMYLDCFLAATMYDGFKFFRLDKENDFNPLNVIHFGDEQCSSTIAYGISWLPSDTLDAVTCTFYDAKIQYWSIHKKTC